MTSLTVASLNTFGVTINPGNLIMRYKAVASYFDTSSVDVIHFQEVFTYFHLVIFKLFLKTYPYCQYRQSYFGPKGGLVIFSRIPLEESKYISFSKKHIPFGLSMLELMVQKGILITELKNSTAYLVNTHLTAVVNHGYSKESKYYKELSSEISEFHNALGGYSGKIAIAAGDFNIDKKSGLYKQLIDIEMLCNPFKKDDSPTRHQAFVSAKKKPNCIDYLFIYGKRNVYAVKNKQRIFTDKFILDVGKTGYATDHIGLQLSLEIK